MKVLIGEEEVGWLTTTTLVGLPLASVVATVVVKAVLPDEVVIVWRDPLDVGRSTTTTLVGVPLTVVSTVVVSVTLPDEVVMVESAEVG